MTRRIAILNRGVQNGQGATGRLAQDLISALRDQGDDVVTINVPHPSARTLIGWVRDMIGLVRGACALNRVDIVITMTDPPLLIILGGILARLHRARHIHWVQDLYPDLLPALGVPVPGFILSALRWILRPIYQNCAQIVTIGSCMRERLITHYRLDPGRITVIENWPDRIFDVGDADHRIPRPSPGPFTVFYGGTLGRAHPISGLGAAIRQLPTNSVQFSFVGNTKRLHARLQNILGPAHHWPPSVRVQPSLSDSDYAVAARAAGCHLVLMEDKTAGLLVPSKAMTALAARRPLLFAGPKTSSLARLIDHTQCGVVVDPADGEAIAQAITRWRENPTLWDHHARGAMAAGRIRTASLLIQSWMDLLDGCMPESDDETDRKKLSLP